MPDLADRQFRRQYRRKHRLDTRTAFLGDGNSPSQVRINGTNKVYIQYPASASNTSNKTWPTTVKMDIDIGDAPGTPVVIGYDEEGELAVLGIASKVRAAVGSPGPVNTTTNQLNKWVDLNFSPLLRAAPMGSGAPLYISLLGFPYIDSDGVYHDFRGISGGIDVSSYVPGSANQHRLVAIWLKKDDTAEVTGSTAKSQADPINSTDVQECVTARSAKANPSAIYRLYTGQTSIADTDKYIDFRQWLNIPQFSIATLTTPGNTTTTLVSIAVSELQAVTINAIITAYKSDYSAAMGGTLMAVVRRASGGNVTLVDSVTTVPHEDSGGSPTFTLDVDTGTQAARIRVTGITAETWNWKVRYETLVS